tara:strand:+ start:13832 stop:15433 length:1602 start_codon:yes stop_codon:yes gene_type:complete
MAAGPTKSQAKEIVKSGKDPVYFINKYAKIQHPQRGRIKFDTYSFQDDCVRAYNDHRFNVIVKSRQLGLSTVSAIYAVWLAIFYRDKNILVIATKLAVAQNFIKKVKIALDSLPSWLVMPGVKERTKTHVAFTNGSQIKAIPTSEDAGRSEALSLLIVDEAAFIRNFDELWMGLYSTLSTGGRAVVISTPNGIGGMYHKLAEEAKLKQNQFNHIELPWWVHPERDDEWFQSESKNMSKKQISQELLCDFSASGDTFVTSEIVEMLRMQIETPIEKWGPGGNVWQWKYPAHDGEYVISADVARGDGGDYSTFQVLDAKTCEQIAEFRGRIPPDQFGLLLAEAGKRYNDALVCPENNTFGYTTILKLVEVGYKNLYFKSAKDKFNVLYGSNPTGSVSKIGFHTNVATRGPILTLLEERLRNKTLKVRSSRLTEELKTFVWKGNKAQAKKGSHDDLVMALAIGNSLVEASGPHAVKNVDMAKAMLGGFSVNAEPDNKIKPIRHFNGINPLIPMPADAYAASRRSEDDIEEFSWLLK